MADDVENGKSMNVITKSNVMYRVLLFMRMINTPDNEEYKRIRKELTNNK